MAQAREAKRNPANLLEPRTPEEHQRESEIQLPTLCKDAYNKDLDIQAAIDAYKRPEEDLTNVTGLGKASPRPAGK